MAATRSLYRRLRRTARFFDQNEALKALVLPPEPHLAHADVLVGACSELVSEYLGPGRVLYAPSDTSGSGGGDGVDDSDNGGGGGGGGGGVVEDEEGRMVIDVVEGGAEANENSVAPPDGMGDMEAFVVKAFRDPERVREGGLLLQRDAGEACLHMMLRIADIVVAVNGVTDPVPGLEGMEGELKVVNNITPGVLLVEHPGVSDGRRVILVVDIVQNVQSVHGNEDWVMIGYVINRPLPEPVGHYMADLTVSAPLMAPMPLFHGGNTESTAWSVLHRFADFDHAVPVGPHSLFAGGSLQALTSAIKGSETGLTDIKVLGGMEKWVLDMERMTFDGDQHFIAVGGPGVTDVVMLPAMLHAPEDRLPPKPDSDTPSPVDGNESDSDTPIPEYDAYFHQDVVWAHVMREIGGEYSGWAHLPAMATEEIADLKWELPPE